MSDINTAENPTGEDTPATPPVDNNQGTPPSPSDAGSNNSDVSNDKDIPFHQHPRWKEREQEWNDRFSQQEKSIGERISQAVTDAIKQQKEPEKPATTSTPIPVWFGGSQEQWDAYQADLLKQFETVEQRTIEKFQGSQKAQADAVKEANQYFDDSIAEIEKNNPGTSVDREALLKIVLAEDLIDSKGRWNYKAGWAILSGKPAPAPKPTSPDNTDKKNLADATTRTDAGDGKGDKKNFVTNETFKDPSKRPW